MTKREVGEKMADLILPQFEGYKCELACIILSGMVMDGESLPPELKARFETAEFIASMRSAMATKIEETTTDA